MFTTNALHEEPIFLSSVIYLQIKANSAASGPPIGPLLGQCGIPAAPFCKEFNDRTTIYNSTVICSVVLYLFADDQYQFDIKFPTSSYFFKKVCIIRKGFGKPG